MLNNRLKISLICFAGGLVLWFLTGYLCARHMTSRRMDVYKTAPGKLNSEDINLTAGDGVPISAWYIRGDSGKAVILLPGIGANRMSCVSRAEYYLEKGFSVLLPDLRGTGSSEGEVVSFGWNESKDLKACYEFLKEQKIEKIAVHGCSLGAATITYSLKDIHDYYFIVLESCYDNIDQAFENRVAKFHLPDFLYFPVRFFIEREIGAKTTELKPEEFIKCATAPVLIMAGDAEVQVKVPETRKLYDNCGSDKKSLYFFKNGKHEDFREKHKEQHTTILNEFMSKHLKD
jgi:esterase/lipase